MESLTAREYPGRVIIIGKDPSGQNAVVVYAITGRSASSQMRKLEFEENAVWVKPTEDFIRKEENIDLLVYPALFFCQGIAVSNGRQTDDIKNSFRQSQNPVEALMLALRKWDHEPDAPHYTPRIGGCVLFPDRAGLAIVRRAANGSSARQFFEVPMEPGKGKMIATYAGENRDPLPAFDEQPAEVEVAARKADDFAETVYEALGPETGENDYRVSVACAFCPDVRREKYEIYIVNRNERM